MSLMDKIKEFFSGGSTGEQDHAGHGRTDDYGAGAAGTQEAGMTAPLPPAEPTGMSPAPGTVAMPDPLQDEPREGSRSDDL